MRMMNISFDSLPEPGNRFTLGEEIGCGAWARVVKAIDTESNDKTVAIKIQLFEGEQRSIIDEEYRILRDYSEHPNLPNFYGVYRNKGDAKSDEIWFVLEYCEGGSAADFVTRLNAANRRISEEHVAYILRETVNALTHLHRNHYVHRDVRGRNILLTAEGEVKLCDFGLTATTGDTMGKRSTCIGSPCWMAPEMFANEAAKRNGELYGSRVDVWALGITAIEMGDGVAPFADMHPTRAMFQIVRNPPPNLYRPANWTQNYNDFIAECLEKNPDNRPFMMELLEHPFFTNLIGPNGSDHHLSCEIKHLLSQIGPLKAHSKPEVSIVEGHIKKFNADREKMIVEDLAALDKISEDKIINEIRERLSNGDSYTFIGDVLLSLNSNELPKEYPRSFHNKYVCKSRSENSPHIFSVADSAFEDMLHHEEPQHIIFAGESHSGKTTNLRLAIKHLTFLGGGNKGCGERIMGALNVVHALVNAGTPLNADSTRCALQTQLTFGQTGKISGAIFWIYLLDKLRVSSTDMNQSNFHIFYYFYDAMVAGNEFSAFELDDGRRYRYLRIADETAIKSNMAYVRDDPEGNVLKFREFEAQLKELDLDDDQVVSIRKILAAILILGEVRFSNEGKFATIENIDEVHKVAKLLELDEKKFEWSLINYCLVRSGMAEKRKHTNDEARDARDVLAAAIYCRLVDWIANIINQKFLIGRAVFGDTNVVSLTDMFGFECFLRNHTEQLLINSLNEQLQYHYNQRMFAWEMLEQEEEQIPSTAYRYNDNKMAVDHLMTKPYGLFYIIDDATKGRMNYEFITDTIINKKNTHVQRVSKHEFSVAHYTGKVTYDSRDMPEKNRDFVPPEMVETLRASHNAVVKVMFTNQLSKTGNLTVANEQQPQQGPKSRGGQKFKWGQALVAEKQKAKKINTLSRGQYSQIHKMRTLASVFRATSLEILKGLSIGGNSGNTHFVRCIRATLDSKPRGFQTDMVHQQIRALAILDTAVARQKGFPQRVSFQEFLRRYKFLAFDFDENVDLTKDNCRLLLIRLKMEGWAIGASKVFLKYYNVEYLSRLYETQVKKIVKVQSMMRAFLAKRNVASKLKSIRQDSVKRQLKRQPSGDEAAITIQKAYRGFKARQKYGPLLNARTGEIDTATATFIRAYAKRWKEKSIFQVLLHYRAARYQDLVNLSQQIHIYNLAVVSGMKTVNKCLLLEKVDPQETNPALLGPLRPAVSKLPFRLNEVPFFDTSYMCDPLTGNVLTVHDADSDNEEWDAPLRRTVNISSHILTASHSFDEPKDSTLNSIDECWNEKEPSTSNEPQSRRNSKELLTKPAVYKKRAAPVPAARDDIIPSVSVEKSALNPDLGSAIGKLNPVKEMQILGRVSTNDDDDEPPFNFQGMLRKTKHQRASMKRSKSETNNNENAMHEASNVVFNSGAINSRKSSLHASHDDFDFQANDSLPIALPRKEVAPMPRDRQLSFGEEILLGGATSLENIGTYVQEEIQPGVILEGYAVEL